MEENIAILMADLTGYTALTETHGSYSAADLIDKYVAIVEACLVGDSKLHERTGDEVMIVSKSPDSLLATSLLLMKATMEENFLQVHGGLHYGKTLRRNNRYFGAAINLTSRIASKADPGCFWCSDDFANALSDKSLTNLEPKGKHSFKNINEEKEIFMISSDYGRKFFIDPVCRMLLLDTNKATRHPDLEGIFFCSPGCLNLFTNN